MSNMTNEEAIARAAREILRGVQAQHPEVQMYQGDGLPPDLAVVILSPSGLVRPVRFGVGDRPDFDPLPLGVGSEGQLETELVQLNTALILPYGTSTTYYLDKLLDARMAKNVVLYIDSSCDQALTIQAVGSYSDTPKEPTTLVNIEASQSLAAGSTAVSRLSLGFDLDINWHPFLGVTIASGGTPPTTGGVRVQAAIRRWVQR